MKLRRVLVRLTGDLGRSVASYLSAEWRSKAMFSALCPSCGITDRIRAEPEGSVLIASMSTL